MKRVLAISTFALAALSGSVALSDCALDTQLNVFGELGPDQLSPGFTELCDMVTEANRIGALPVLIIGDDDDDDDCPNDGDPTGHAIPIGRLRHVESSC